MKIRLTKIKISQPPPDQLEIKNGKLIAVSTGSAPDFSELPDGKYSLLPREVHIDMRSDLHLFYSWGA